MYIMSMICIDVCILHIISVFNIMSILFVCVYTHIYNWCDVFGPARSNRGIVHIEDSHGAPSENCERI